MSDDQARCEIFKPTGVYNFPWNPWSFSLGIPLIVTVSNGSDYEITVTCLVPTAVTMKLLWLVGFERQWQWSYCDMLGSNGSGYGVTVTCRVPTAVTMKLLWLVGFERQWQWNYCDMLGSNGSVYGVTVTCWVPTAVIMISNPTPCFCYSLKLKCGFFRSHFIFSTPYCPFLFSSFSSISRYITM